MEKVGNGYFKCPRCDKVGQWSSDRSQAQHFRQCSGPMLFDKFETGRSNKKRQCMEMVAAKPTGNQLRQQIASEIHAGHADGTVRTAQTLAAMPSLHRLAQPWEGTSSTEYNFVDFGGEDSGDWEEGGEIDAIVGEEQHDHFQKGHTDYQARPMNHWSDVQYRTVGNVSVPVETSMCTNYANLPNGIVYQLHMMHILNKHREVDLKLYSEINECVSYHAKEKNVDFNAIRMYSRKQLVDISTHVYRLHGFKPTMNRVTLSDKSVAVVPTFDVKTMLLNILNDKSKMKMENIASNYNLFTGKAIGEVTHIDEIHTGWAWEEARAHHCGDDENVLPMGLVAFYDKTHSDLFGALACAPFIVVPTFFNMECRCNTDFWVTLGYVPNIGHGKGKVNQQKSREKLQDQHNCIRVITQQLAQLRDEGYFWTRVMGKIVKVVVWIHMITGDTSGHNELCGKFNSNGNTQCPYRCCLCPHHRLSDSIAQCRLITLKDVSNAEKRPGGLDELSVHKIENAFTGVPISDIVRGIFGMCPAETLHVLGNGIFKYQFICNVQLIGPGESKKKEKDLYDSLFENLARDAARQSEQDYPRICPPRKGFGDGTKMTASDRVGNLFIMLCVSYTTAGKDLLKDGWDRENIPQKNYRDCIKLLLGFERWCMQSNPIAKVKNAARVVGDLIDLIKKSFKRTDGNGWNIPKIHSLAKMIYYMLKFGSAKGVSGQTGERALKEIVKDPAKNTQRRAKCFAEQVANRVYENQVLEYAFDDMKCELGLDYERCDRPDVKRWKVYGRYDMSFAACDHLQRGAVVVVWNDKSKKKLDIDVSKVMKYTIRKFAVAHSWTGPLDVTGYTRGTKMFEGIEGASQFHASEYLSGSSWYDHAMVQFYEDGKDPSDSMTPARIYGFFRYRSKGVPTPFLIHDLGKDPTQIQSERLEDDKLYAVVHTASDYLSWKTIERDFVAQFKFGREDQCIYIIDVDAIISPLFVFKNYGGVGSDRENYFCALPRRKWAQYFDRRI